jgi:hypothetical protein
MRAPPSRTALAFAAFLLSAPAHAAPPLHLLIFAGGKTEADAQRALASFKKLEPLVAKVATLPAGYPRVVESRTLPGLAPGFFIVALGLCAAPGEPLARLKAVYPGTYTKLLTGEAGAEACPKPSGVSVSAPEATAKLGGLVLNAAMLEERGTDARDHDTVAGRVQLVLVDKATGEVLDTQSVEGASSAGSGDGPAGWEYQSCSVSVSAAKAGLTVTRDCSDQRTGCGAGESSIPKAWSEAQLVTISSRALVVAAPKKKVTLAEPCRAGGSEGD